jgi:hypothetical protein
MNLRRRCSSSWDGLAVTTPSAISSQTTQIPILLRVLIKLLSEELLSSFKVGKSGLTLSLVISPFKLLCVLFEIDG